MRIKSVYISDYKNLKDFTLSFDGDSSLDVFVGKNGTGKSNLFEALIKIFHHLNEIDSNDSVIDFDYRIAYEIDGESTSIEWKQSQLKINNKIRKKLGKTPVPDNVLVYYSGHNGTVSTLIRNYEKAFQSSIKGADLSDSRYFLGIGPEYKQLLLVAGLLKHEASPCRRFISEKLGIKEIGNELRVTLKRPYYAGSSDYDVESNSDGDRFWKAKGITRTFLDQLIKCTAAEPQDGRIRTEGYQAGEDKYILYVDAAKLRDAYKDNAPHQLFECFDNLKVLEMLEELSIPLTLENGESAKTSFFSDGQFQSVYIYTITELFKEKHCLTLLDEPDSFLHPEWQHEFLSQVFEISESASKTSHTLLSSHSASTISNSDESLISLFEIDGKSVKVSKASKAKIIHSLSAGLISFSESEARLNIQMELSDTTGPVLFTEGISDEVILEKAWEKLYPGETKPFEIQHAFCCSFLGSLLRRGDIYENHPGRTFFGLFDFDEAYNEWKGCKGDDLELDPRKSLTKKMRGKDCYVMLLPVPPEPTIEAQVINTDTGAHYEGNSRLSIELLFYGIEEISAKFEVDPTQPGNVMRFVGDKVKFAKETVPTLAPKHFKVFEPIFEFIKSKCSTTVI